MRLNILEDEVEDMIECRRKAVEAGCKQAVILPLPQECPGQSTLASFGFDFSKS